MGDKIAANLKWYEKITNSIITNTESFFYGLGKHVALRPYTTIGICWIFVAISAIGFIRFRQEKNPIKLWVPPDSQFVKDSEWLMDTFETAYRAEIVQVVAEDVLSPEVIIELFELDERVRHSITPSGITWEQVCFKIPEVDESLNVLMGGSSSSSSSNNSSKKKNHSDYSSNDFDPSVHLNAATYCKLVETMDKECFEKSILNLWGYNERKIRKLTKQDIVDKINKFKRDPILGNIKNYEDLLGGIGYNSSGHIVSAKSLHQQWMTHLNFTAVDMSKSGNYAGTSDWASIECLEWEQEFLQVMESASKTSKHMDIYYAAGRSFGDVSGETMFQDMDILFIGIFIMIIYVQFVISKFNFVEARIYLGVLGLISVGMAFIVACGLCSLFGVYYGPVHTSLPFLLMGLGVDDMFVMMACWNQLKKEQLRLPLHEKMGIMLQHAGVSITVTTATDVLAFFVGASTILPCLESYCIYAAFGVLATFIFVVTFFLACFTIDQRRVERNVCGILPWRKLKNYVPNEFSQSDTSGKVFNFIFSKIILTWPGKLFVILITIVSFGFSVESALKLEQRFDPRWFIPKSTYLGRYLEEKNKYFPTYGHEAGTFTGSINYTHEFVNIENVVRKLENSTDIVADISSWTEPFRDYVHDYFNTDLHTEVLSDNRFHLYLSKFLFSPKGARFQGNFRFEKPIECGIPVPKIMLSSIDYRFKLFSGPDEHVPAMRRVMAISKDANFSTGDRFSTAWSKIFATWITDEVIEIEVIRNLQLDLLAVMACTAIFLVNIQICFWVFLCILLTMVNVCGFMQRWGLTIDLVTCIGLTLAIGLCVDYATHIGHTFLTIGEGSLNRRALKTVTSIGSAVMYGGFSTLIGVAMLGFSDAYNFQTFFKIFLLVVLFGLFHGVVLFPVILSWFGPKPYYTHIPVQQSELVALS